VDATGRRVQGQKQAARESSADDVQRAMETGGDKVTKNLAELIGALYQRLADDIVKMKEFQGMEQPYRQPRG